MKTRKWELSDILLIVGVTIISMLIRLEVRHVVSGDWTTWWELWFAELYAGGFKALAGNWYDYAPPFVYLLWLISVLPINCMTGFKLMMTGFDFMAAIVAYLIIYEITKNRTKAVITYAIFALSPIFIVNSVLWAQCDMLPMFWVMLCIYFFVKERPSLAMFFFGVAFAFKLQPLWLAPMLVILWINKKVDLKHFLWLPVCYFIGIVPAWIAGRPLGELLTIYISQTEAESWSLALKYSNLYYLIGETGFIEEYHTAGVWLSLAVFMIVLYYIGRKKLKITAEFILLLGGFVGLLAPFFLPQMHERYSFFAEVFLILYVILKPQKFYLPVFQSLTSFMGYSIFLAQDWTLPIQYMPFITLTVLFLTGLEVYRYINDPANQETEDTVEVKAC